MWPQAKVCKFKFNSCSYWMQSRYATQRRFWTTARKLARTYASGCSTNPALRCAHTRVSSRYRIWILMNRMLITLRSSAAVSHLKIISALFEYQNINIALCHDIVTYLVQHDFYAMLKVSIEHIVRIPVLDRGPLLTGRLYSRLKQKQVHQRSLC